MTYRLGADPWPRWLGGIASDDPADPRPFLVPGVRARFRKITRSMKRRAQSEAARMLGEVEEGEKRDLLDMADAGDQYSLLMIRQGLCEWEGVGDADGNPAPVSPEMLDFFLAEDELFEAADEAYVMPEVRRDAEKNGLSASLNGTGEVEMPASDIATSFAATPVTADAGRTLTKTKKVAPTSSTSRKPKRAQKSGT